MGTNGGILPASARFGVVAACALACSAPPQVEAQAAAVARTAGIARYLPLEDATVFSYETTTEPAGDRGLLVLEVRRPRPEAAELVVAGRARRLAITNEGVAHVTGGFLLREPFVVGATFHGDFGQVRVTRVNQEVTVPAGTLRDCIETSEEMTTDAGTKRTVTSYCAGVGIALRETSAEKDDERASERIALKSWGKRFDAARPAAP